jgi:N6-L-threonylcarbamoyladenine synthase
MITLGVETSCDETAVALVEDGVVLANEVSSSVHLHSDYGGVVPEIASRYHTEYIFSVVDKALKDAGLSIREIGLVAVTQGPGLPGSLLVGMAFAKAVSFAAKVPIIGVNHLHAHMFACFLGPAGGKMAKRVFPFIGVVVSGGHTSIYRCASVRDLKCLGRTKDDAVGEAFDKVAKVLGLGYPGGPVVEERAARFGGDDELKLPRPLLNAADDTDFSFSGIKTAVMYHWKGCERTEREKDRICAAFQEAVVEVIEEKTSRAVRASGLKRVAAGGGVVNNGALRKSLSKRAEKDGWELHLSPREYCADNAAMVAALGEALYAEGERSDLAMRARPSWD